MLKSRYGGLKGRISGMKSAASSALESLDTFSQAFMEADAWLSQRLHQASQFQITSANSQEVLALMDKLTE